MGILPPVASIVAEMAADISEKPFLHHVGTEYVLYMVEIEREIGHHRGAGASIAPPCGHGATA
jgi:hypothetical protein